MSTRRILIGSRSFGQSFPEHLDALSAAGFEIVPNALGRSYREDELLVALDGIEAIVTGTDELTRTVIEHADALRVIAKHGVGTENIDLAAARERKIAVRSTPGAMSESVAELAFALMLALARSVVPADRSVRDGQWPRISGVELRGRTLGLIGFGRIARQVAARAQAFEMNVIAHDPFPDTSAAAELGVELHELHSVLERSHFVSLHAAVPAGGGPLLGAPELAKLRPDAFLINTSRGALIDEPALTYALIHGRLGGAGLDVFVQEPPPTSPLFSLDNVVLTPHLGGQTEDALRRMGELTVANCFDALAHDTPA